LLVKNADQLTALDLKLDLATGKCCAWFDEVTELVERRNDFRVIRCP
jgi:hypothetical protein